MIFVDTSAWLAINNDRDTHHQKALQFKAASIKSGNRLVTSDYVLNETYTGLRSRAGHWIAVRFGEAIRTSHVTEIWHVTPETIEDAWRIFKKFSDHHFSFTDCVSFILMKQMRIDVAFTFDSDFRAFGHFQVKP